MPKSILFTVFNARTYLSPKNMLLSADVKIVCADMVLGAQNIHIKQISNFITVKWCILIKSQPKLVMGKNGVWT